MTRSCALAVCVALAATIGGASTSLAEGVQVGDPAPPITGTRTDGQPFSLEATQQDAKAVVVAFTCNACPVAQAYEERFNEFAEKYRDRGVAFVGVNVNPESLEAMKQRAEQQGYEFPYVKDASGDSARSYGAQVTPHLYVIDGEGKIAYIGAFDDDIRQPQTSYLADAVDAVLAGKQPARSTTKAFGCGIKVAAR